MTTLVSAFYLNVAESFNVKINIYIFCSSKSTLLSLSIYTVSIQ